MKRTSFNHHLTEAIVCNVRAIGLNVTDGCDYLDYGDADLLAISNELGLALARVEGEIEWRRMNRERSSA